MIIRSPTLTNKGKTQGRQAGVSIIINDIILISKSILIAFKTKKYHEQNPELSMIQFK